MHSQGHGLSMVGGMAAGTDMDGLGGLAMSMPMPTALGMNMGLGGFVDVGGGRSSGNTSGGEEDVNVGMMLGVYNVGGNNVRVFFFFS